MRDTMHRRAPWLGAVLLGWLGACFDAPAGAVMFSCDPDAAPACPEGYTCEADGCCHRDGTDVDAHLNECKLAPSTEATSLTTVSATEASSSSTDATDTSSTGTSTTEASSSGTDTSSGSSSSGVNGSSSSSETTSPESSSDGSSSSSSAGESSSSSGG